MTAFNVLRFKPLEAVIDRIKVRVDVAQTRLYAVESPHDTLEVGCNHLAVEAGEGSQREGLVRDDEPR